MVRRGSEPALSLSKGQVLDFRFFDHRITLSALTKTLGGIVRPICFAAMRLITNSNFIGYCTGKLAGFARCKLLLMRLLVGGNSRSLILRSWLQRVLANPDSPRLYDDETSNQRVASTIDQLYYCLRKTAAHFAGKRIKITPSLACLLA